VPDNHPPLQAADDIAEQGGKEQPHALNLSSFFILHTSFVIYHCTVEMTEQFTNLVTLRFSPASTHYRAICRREPLCHANVTKKRFASHRLEVKWANSDLIAL
jgi:hypothetical protein